MIHDLKTWDVYWDAVASGDKTFEGRRDDRGFQKGDIVRLLRCEKRHGAYVVELDFKGNPEHVLEKRITYILTGGQFGIEPGYVVLALGDVV
jgi:hypothetical protein